jgi:RNase H-fold protein (predicted Holliday junction resolvase)
MSPAPIMPCVLAIDPGSAKCGVAVVQPDGTVLFRAIITADSVVEETRTLVTRYQPVVILVGAGTGSKPALKALQEAEGNVTVCPVDESHTSEAARVRFVAENPARGWERLLPRSLRTPTRPYDDYVAVILAERYWQSTSARNS